MIRIFVGYDPREAIAYHTFCQSVIQNASKPVSFIPLAKNMLGSFDGRRDGSNDFIYSRFLIPYLCDFRGHALFFDGDMVVNADVAELWKMREYFTAVKVVKHDYKTKFPVKYLGNKNEDYPRKNWSSVILWNCGSHFNSVLTPKYLAGVTGEVLHRFQWLNDERIGELPAEWNHLVGEYPDREDAKCYHYTIGTPCFGDLIMGSSDQSRYWHEASERASAPMFLNYDEE